MPDPAVALLLVVADQTDAVVTGCFDQRDAAVVAGRPDAGDVDAFAAAQFFGEGRSALARVGAVRRMESVARGVSGQQRPADAFGQCAQPRVCCTVAAEAGGHQPTISSRL